MITTIATNEEIPQILVEGIFDDEAYVVAEDAAEFALKNGFGEGAPTAAFRVRVFGCGGRRKHVHRALSLGRGLQAECIDRCRLERVRIRA